MFQHVVLEPGVEPQEGAGEHGKRGLWNECMTGWGLLECPCEVTLFVLLLWNEEFTDSICISSDSENGLVLAAAADGIELSEIPDSDGELPKLLAKDDICCVTPRSPPASTVMITQITSAKI